MVKIEKKNIFFLDITIHPHIRYSPVGVRLEKSTEERPSFVSGILFGIIGSCVGLSVLA
jgi:hypothetical protein